MPGREGLIMLEKVKLFLLVTLNILHTFSSVSFVEFEEVNWVTASNYTNIMLPPTSYKFQCGITEKLQILLNYTTESSQEVKL